MIVYLAELHRPYYEGESIVLGIFSTEEIAWEAIHKKIAEQKIVAEEDEYGTTEIYEVKDFGVVSIEIDQPMWL